MTQLPVAVQPARSSPGSLEFTGPAAVAPTTSLRGSQMLAATIQADPLLGRLGYWYSIAVMADPAAAKRIIEAVSQAVFEKVETMLDAGYKALGLIRGAPRARYVFLEHIKTPEMWAEQMQKFPKDYEEDMADLESLRAKALAGEL